MSSEKATKAEEPSAEYRTKYAEIWKTLSAIDVSEQVEKKNGLSYLSWAWAWGILMKHYPEAVYHFPPHEVHPDGTVTVHCNVAIGDCIRTMWLPVMDYKNIAIKNPDARKISDTKMRCLVKNLAMWGLGFHIYAGEDLPVTPSEEVEPEPVRKPSPAKAAPAKKAEPTKQEGFDIPTEEGAAELVLKLVDLATTMCVDTDGLKAFWVENKKFIDILDHNYPKQYQALKEAFTQLKDKVGSK
jgi:hypothetical protein